MKAKKVALTAATLSAFLGLGGMTASGRAYGTPGQKKPIKVTASSNKVVTKAGKKGHKAGKKGHKGGKKSKKGSSTTTPPPK